MPCDVTLKAYGDETARNATRVLAHGRLLLYFTHNYLLFYAPQ